MLGQTGYFGMSVSKEVKDLARNQMIGTSGKKERLRIMKATSHQKSKGWKSGSIHRIIWN